MKEQLKKTISVQNDSFYEILTGLVHKERLNFSDDWDIKKYLVQEDIMRTTEVDKKIIEYIHKNLKEWHTLIKNTNASKIFLALNILKGQEGAKNNFTLCNRIKVNKKKISVKGRVFQEREGNIGEPTVRYWIGHIRALDLIVKNHINYNNETLWRWNVDFDENSNPADLVKEGGKAPMDKLKLTKVKLTAYFCSYMLEQKTLAKAKKGIQKEFSFLNSPIKKDDFL